MYSIWHLTINFCCLQSPQFHISTAPAQRTPGIGPGLTWWTCRSLPPASPWGSDILEIGFFDLDCKVMEQRTHSERNMSNTHIYIYYIYIYNYIYIYICYIYLIFIVSYTYPGIVKIDVLWWRPPKTATHQHECNSEVHQKQPDSHLR